jgi:integrase
VHGLWHTCAPPWSQSPSVTATGARARVGTNVGVKKIVSSNPNARRPVRWEAMWYVEGRQVTRRFDTKAQAAAWEAQVRHEVASGRYISARDGATTFASYAERYLAHARVADTTMELYRSHLRRHILPKLGGRSLGSLRRSDLVAFVTDLTTSGLAPSTVKVVYGITAGILRSAVDDQLLLSSPCHRVPLPTVHRDAVRHLTPEQARALLEAARRCDRPAIALALGTGMRQGELLGLQVSAVSWLRPPQVSVHAQLKTVTGRPPYLAPPKTRASQRVIPLPAFARDALAAHLSAAPSSGLVFLNRRGNPWRRGLFNETVWKPALSAAGLPATLGFHCLRHTYASGLIAEGLHPRVVMARLGHASIEETMNTYGHLFPDSLEQTTTALDRLFGAG